MHNLNSISITIAGASIATATATTSLATWTMTRVAAMAERNISSTTHLSIIGRQRPCRVVLEKWRRDNEGEDEKVEKKGEHGGGC